jgi:hypothetical protein
LDKNDKSGDWERRSFSLVAHAHPVPCVEGVRSGTRVLVSVVPVEGRFGLKVLRAYNWPIGFLALLDTDFGKGFSQKCP